MPRKSKSVGIVLSSTVLLATAAAAQQEDGWILKSNAGISLTQSSFSTSWAGDEVGTVSWTATWNSEATKRLEPWANWQNSLLLQFGQTHQQDQQREHWLAPKKSSDKITYRGIVRLTYGGLLDPFVALDLDSQFFQEDDTGAETRLFTPSLITESVGIARALVATERRRMVTRLGFAAKERIDRLVFDAVASEFTTETSAEGGFEWFTEARIASKEERTVYKSELRVFKAVASSEKDSTRRLHWPAVDVDWQNTLTNKVTKWMAFDLFWQLRYDKQIDERGQFKQTLGVGLTWQLI